ncbi:MAG: tRNA glutamyl-Q(34) synthetase GluQRS, partial [Muribaculaceae bacterium]|nr:tRNA glutamyl-Q(34) synthetase GluQRS [Muribaculaceae bacterium]
MHLGNIYTALLSWLSVKSRGGRWILRIEDLDPQRSKIEYARLIEDDLHWLGLEWDEGGLDGVGPNGPYVQSRRHHLYEEALERLKASGLCYPCSCTRADILATQAPHESDGRVVYKGTCRPLVMPSPYMDRPGAAVRLMVPDEDISFTDRIKGPQTVNLARHCGDFIVRRGDGAWSYQLAVVVDDALMGVTEVMRGDDLLLSAAQQIYLYRLLGFDSPEFAHVPLVC